VLKREPFPPGVNVPATRDPTAQFRQDLKISIAAGNPSERKTYLVQDPVTHASFSFGEEEYFLCRAMDGISTSEEVLARFSKHFGVEMTEEHFRNFEEHLLTMGLATIAEGASESPLKSEERSAPEPGPPAAERKKTSAPYWKICDPASFFSAAYRFVRPFNVLFRILVLSLIPGVPIALYAIFRHDTDFRLDLRTLHAQIGYLGGLLFGLILANLVRCIVQGVVCAAYQVAPRAFGIKLRRGVLPRFYIDKSKVRRLGRSPKLWIYGTSLLLRLFFIVGGTLLWMFSKDAATLLPLIAVTLAQAGLIGLIIQLLPVENHDGYRWLITFFNLPQKMIGLAATVFRYRIQGKPLPDTLAGVRGTRYLLYALFLIAAITYGGYRIAVLLADTLTQTFPDLLGRATWYVFLAFLAYFVLQWAIGRFTHQSSTSRSRDDEELDPQEGEEEVERESEEAPQGFAELVHRHRAIVLSIAACLLLLVPFAYRPGGEIQVLPPVQQQIQAPISGRITEVNFEGGDGKLISQGTTVAKMISDQIENQILTLDQSRAQQLATIEKTKAELSKLVAGYRDEKISAAQAKLDHAIEQVNVASQELAAAQVADAYTSIVLPSFEKLYKSGSIAYLQYQEQIKAAGINKINVERQRKNLSAMEKNRDAAQAELDLLQTGSRQEDIDAARHSLAEAEAALSRIDQQIQYATQQQKKGELAMPLNGYLVTPHLSYKKGMYLAVGESFATAQDNTQPLVEVQLPEYDTEGVVPGANALVKLFANPGSPLHGKVLSVQPAAIPVANQKQVPAIFGTRMFSVLIEIEKPPFALKAGMTGYAKISAGYQPLGLLLARPILRFVQIELWSWLP
jgi:putative peptide zinc metalloprotease protein